MSRAARAAHRGEWWCVDRPTRPASRYRGQRSSRVFLLCSSDFGRSLEESRDDLQSFGYGTWSLTIRSGSYTTLLDATEMSWSSADGPGSDLPFTEPNASSRLRTHPA